MRFALILSLLLVSACASPGRQASPAEAVPAQQKEITIALLGATGMVGGFILEEALSRGYGIRALARTPQKLAAYEEQISIVQGEARDFRTIDTLLQGTQVVISALGPVRSDGDDANMLNTTASALIVQLMPAHTIEQYIVVSGAAVHTPRDDRNLTGWLLRRGASIAFCSILKDKQAEYQLLTQSEVDWTLVRCPVINSEPYEQAAIASLVTPTSFSLRASELARFILDQIGSNEFAREAPFLSSH